MKLNTESSKKERLRVLLGSASVIVGVFIVLIIGAMIGYHNVFVWVIGMLFIVAGMCIAKSVAVANFLNDIFRF